jgi:UDP-N-acetylmuramoylalanine--D-glutamate ligase
VTINDRRTAEQLAQVCQALTDLPIRWVLGGHPAELLDTTDVVCISGGIPLENPIVAGAQQRGLPLTNDTQVFLEVVPCKTVGITGSAGKTTTTTLVGRMAQAMLGPRAHVGGNIGEPLLNHVDGMHPDDLAILEISSFQLEQMTRSTNVAAILNITPNHLDRHGTMEAYAAAKQRMLDFQSRGDIAVLDREDRGAWALRDKVHGRLVTFGFREPAPGMDGTYLAGENLTLREQGRDFTLMRRDQIQLRGDHNCMNVLAAFAIGKAAGLPLGAMIRSAAEFRGVPHREEFVRTWHGASWYNNSIATAPERTLASLRAFEEPVILLLGGRDKDLPWEKLAQAVHARVDHVILFGEASPKIAAAIGENLGPQLESIDVCANLQQAVQTAARLAAPGDVVLFSPGGTSFDEFRDFEERGEMFRKWVSELS